MGHPFLSSTKSFFEKVLHKMVLVLGNSAKKIELKDLNDVVYYKQQKSFNDSDLDRSSDLKREIKAGRIIVLKQNRDSSPSNNGQGFESAQAPVIPSVVLNPPTDTAAPVIAPDTRIDMLLEKIVSLEKRLSDNSSEDKDVLLKQFMDSVDDKLNKRLEGVPSSPVAPANKDSGTDAKIDMLIDLIKSNAMSSGYAPSPVAKVSDYTKVGGSDEVYVPSVRVEDANAKINLKTRIIESGDQVSNALDALKSLKNRR